MDFALASESPLAHNVDAPTIMTLYYMVHVDMFITTDVEVGESNLTTRMMSQVLQTQCCLLHYNDHQIPIIPL